MPKVHNSTHKLSVSDLYLAVFLKCKYKLKVIDLEKQGQRLTFVFDINGLNGQDLISSFYSGDDTVGANDFVKELKDMKALVHNF
jgi:hypothetical protein